MKRLLLFFYFGMGGRPYLMRIGQHICCPRLIAKEGQRLQDAFVEAMHEAGHIVYSARIEPVLAEEAKAQRFEFDGEPVAAEFFLVKHTIPHISIFPMTESAEKDVFVRFFEENCPAATQGAVCAA